MNVTERKRTVFKECPMCGVSWDSRDGFLADPGIELVGYQVHFEELTAGFCLFNHACESTLAVTVGDFRSLYDGPVFEDRKTGTDECPEYCLHKEELRPCPARCECAYVREILQLIAHYPRIPSDTQQAHGL
ncbi:MAG: hypothetical protein ABIG44_15940 [Planctomycetota bacterium]